MNRITMCVEDEFSGKVIGSFDLTEYADRVYNQALDDFIKKAEEERRNIDTSDHDDYYLGKKTGYKYSIDIAEGLRK